MRVKGPGLASGQGLVLVGLPVVDLVHHHRADHHRADHRLAGLRAVHPFLALPVVARQTRPCRQYQVQVRQCPVA
jgi:hypothetical protein